MKLTAEQLFRLSQASLYYRKEGFEEVDVDWAVAPPFVDMTLPVDGARQDLSNGLSLVGSAEQSFLAKYDRLSEGKRYQATTPCWRPLDYKPPFHLSHFVKCELFVPTSPASLSDRGVWELAFVARRFMEQFAPPLGLKFKVTSATVDIEFGGIELGSYGYRKATVFPGTPNEREIAWYFGTGLAEPRFGSAVFGEQQ